ncbi:conjugal transfer protein TrbK (plasmid) [Hartmannibacter diazotrophicus]|uniref:Conjugal transfer protein TrbK n=1 Tax=Hartmannibacter diazotrophicus TaxID=1482074 RepID=A0A2C9DDW9_9HYPH|nr:entry exclusion protein TrbK [Hartmannibacter diazotrophicus]SON58487.1 conjugal transfer protein TrbK [Hartmannibacter diazotrophicus]
MSRIVVIASVALVVVAIGFVVWTSFGLSDTTVFRGQAASTPRTFDTTGGQEMRPRWGTNIGEADGAKSN